MTRLAVLGIGVAGLAVVLLVAAGGLEQFGHYPGPYGDVIARVVVPERHATELVGAVTFDYRGVDTLGEEFILLAAACGCVELLRVRRAEREREEREAPGLSAPAAAVRWLAALLVGPVLVLGLYVIAHGHLTPGGGFQGGVIVAAGLLLAYAGGHAFALGRIRAEPLLEAAEAAGAGAFAVLAVSGLVVGAAALENVLPLGTAGQLLSGGTIPVSNVAVGLEVAGAVALVLSEFLDQALLVRRR